MRPCNDRIGIYFVEVGVVDAVEETEEVDNINKFDVAGRVDEVNNFDEIVKVDPAKEVDEVNEVGNIEVINWAKKTARTFKRVT